MPENAPANEPDGVTVWFNARCSKCRTTQGILEERGVEADYVRYLETAPDRGELEQVLAMLGTDDPRAIARRGEDRWKELGLDDADRDGVLDAMAANPILIERPIVIRGGRAVVARPPERVLELLDEQ
jgi:arsenate reductase (glutaredoxin)